VTNVDSEQGSVSDWTALTKRPCQLRHRRLCVNLTTEAEGGHTSFHLMVRSQKEHNFISALQRMKNGVSIVTL
jgi:hypothetical protein